MSQLPALLCTKARPYGNLRGVISNCSINLYSHNSCFVQKSKLCIFENGFCTWVENKGFSFYFSCQVWTAWQKKLYICPHHYFLFYRYVGRFSLIFQTMKNLDALFSKLGLPLPGMTIPGPPWELMQKLYLYLFCRSRLLSHERCASMHQEVVRYDPYKQKR